MPIIIGVRMKSAGKVYYFSPNDMEFKKGDDVIVETVRGMEYATVHIANKHVEDSEIVGELKPVLRKATAQDTEHQQELLSKRDWAISQTKEKIRKHGLEMKLIDVDFTFDNSKVIFYFTAEGRVDFRELVKDLAGVFRMRIELRQVGIRDEAKVLGGFGPCGRTSCCNSFLGDFERVSIKMAKVQGLSLNPGKISGLCGRLMCCLKYENEHYTQTSKVMPKLGSEVATPDGKGTVLSCDMLKLKVKVKMQNKDDSFKVEDFYVDQLKFATQGGVDKSQEGSYKANDNDDNDIADQLTEQDIDLYEQDSGKMLERLIDKPAKDNKRLSQDSKPSSNDASKSGDRSNDSKARYAEKGGKPKNSSNNAQGTRQNNSKPNNQGADGKPNNAQNDRPSNSKLNADSKPAQAQNNKQNSNKPNADSKNDKPNNKHKPHHRAHGKNKGFDRAKMPKVNNNSTSTNTGNTGDKKPQE